MDKIVSSLLLSPHIRYSGKGFRFTRKQTAGAAEAVRPISPKGAPHEPRASLSVPIPGCEASFLIP